MKRIHEVWLRRGTAAMEHVACSIYDIGSLFECEQIIDVDMKKTISNMDLS